MESNADRKYRELIEKIDGMSKMVYILLIISMIVGIGIALPVTAVNYFVYDMGDDSYFLPVPVM